MLNKRRLTRKQHIAYGMMGLPLGFAGLPIYIHAPKFYVDQFGLSLAIVGVALLISRMLDTIPDPFIGVWSDRKSSHGVSRYSIIKASIPVMALAFFLLFNPHYAPKDWIVAWFTLTMIAVYIAGSFLCINYYSLNAEYSEDYHEKNAISAWREGFALIGVVVAAALPQFLTNTYDAKTAYFYLSITFVVLIIVLPALAFRVLPEPALKSKKIEHQTLRQMIHVVSGDRLFLVLLLAFFINSLANAVPATLVLFFIDDVLNENAFGGNFLAVYFLAGVAAMPLWLKVSKWVGKKNSVLISMILAMVWFVWCFMLGAHDKWQYFTICILTGLSVGADFALFPSILSDVIQKRSKALKKAPNSGSYFGVWNLSSKLALALAGGITLPMLAFMGYQPGVDNDGINYLSFTYGIVPCVLKAIAAYVLWRSPIDEER